MSHPLNALYRLKALYLEQGSRCRGGYNYNFDLPRRDDDG